MTTMVDLITDIIGTYTPLTGTGVETVNWPWITGALVWLLVIWFVFKLILRLIQGSSRSK